MLGEECSGATLPVMPLMEQAKVRLLNAGSSSIKVSDPGSPWMLRVMPNEVMQGVDIATNAYKRLNARSAVLLYENSPRSPPEATRCAPRQPRCAEHDAIRIDVGMLALDRPVAPRFDRPVDLLVQVRHRRGRYPRTRAFPRR